MLMICTLSQFLDPFQSKSNTLKELINAELFRAEPIFAELTFADFVQIRKN